MAQMICLSDKDLLTPRRRRYWCSLALFRDHVAWTIPETDIHEWSGPTSKFIHVLVDSIKPGMSLRLPSWTDGGRSKTLLGAFTFVRQLLRGCGIAKFQPLLQ